MTEADESLLIWKYTPTLGKTLRFIRSENLHNKKRDDYYVKTGITTQKFGM